MRYGRYHGKFTRFRKDAPKAWAICDISGLRCMHSDLVKHMEYAGDGLYWTGYWVNKKFLDKPNPQLLTPRIYADPYPVQYPRPDIPEND